MFDLIKNKVNKIDVLDGLSKIEDNSIDIILIDPPYNIGKDFGNNSDKQSFENYIKWSTLWLHDSVRVLKESGTIFIYGFSEILAHISVLMAIPNRWLIWHYTNKNVPRAKFWQRSHESIIMGWKNEKERVFNLDSVREPYTKSFLNNAAGKVRKTTKGRFSNGSVETIYNAHENGALPRDVLNIPALSGGAGRKERYFLCKTCMNSYQTIFLKDHKKHEIIYHPTQKPSAITNKLLNSAMPKDNGLVLVPFAGSGSELVVIRKLGMDFLSFDINDDYVNLSNFNLKNNGF